MCGLQAERMKYIIPEEKTMAIIRPFKAVRPGKGMEAKIAALPYDVYSRKEAKVVVDANPESFLAIDRAETISELFTLVKEQNINMRMHTLPGASNIRPKRLEIRSFPPGTSYLDKLKAAVRLTVENTK